MNRKSNTYFYLMVVAWILFSQKVCRSEERSTLFDSVRANARGQTNVAAFDSDEASRFNPATLGEADIYFQTRWLEIDGFIGNNSISTASDLIEIITTANGFSALAKFDQKFGERQYGKGQLSFLSMRFGGFELSPFAMNMSAMEMGLPQIPSMEWTVDTAVGLNMSYGFELNAQWAIGLSFRPIYRWYVNGKIDFVDLMDFLPPAEVKFEEYSPLVSGFALASDVGLIWKPTKNFRWGLTVHDLGDSQYVQDTQTLPPVYRQMVSTGILSRIEFGRFNLDLSADLHDLSNRDGLNLLRLLKLGAELGTSVLSRDHDYGVLLGVSEGYLSSGLFADIWLVRFELSNYGVELGQSPGQKQDRRWGFSARSSMTF